MSFRVKRNTMLHKVLDPAREAAIQEEIARGHRYVIDGGLRRVPPYYFTYLTFCKQRWIGRTLQDIFSAEFRDRPESYYHKAVADGLVLVNGRPATVEQKMQNGDLMIHRTHKHEQPVSADPIKIVFQDDRLVVVDKPGGVPAHPTGRFKFNSVMAILEKEHGFQCHPCNRLDRLTSGLMFLAKTPKGADEIGQQIRDRAVTKQYLALVHGEFPLDQVSVDLPMQTVNPKVALNMVDANGKHSLTQFRRVDFDPVTNRSLVLCMPHTGRTHQIRVHLQYLGFPIANDPIYSNDRAWGPTLGRHATAQNTDVEAVCAALDNVGKTEPARSLAFPESKGEMLSGAVCDECATPLYTDPGPNDLDLWLHALRYYANDGSWSYETELPKWAVPYHREFMDLALREARKAPDLDGAFAVGAVLVHNGRVLVTGYTRELEGNTHAEQNVLAKLAGQELPPGTVLYTSMEPCTERLSGNEPCCNRVLAHPAIRTVFVGVMEPATFIANNSSRKKLEDAGLVYLQIPGVADEALAIAQKGHK